MAQVHGPPRRAPTAAASYPNQKPMPTPYCAGRVGRSRQAIEAVFRCSLVSMSGVGLNLPRAYLVGRGVSRDALVFEAVMLPSTWRSSDSGSGHLLPPEWEMLLDGLCHCA